MKSFLTFSKKNFFLVFLLNYFMRLRQMQKKKMHETLIWWIRTLVPFGGTMFFLINLFCYLKILPLEHLAINYFNQSIRNMSSSFHCLTLSAIQVFCLMLNYNSNGYFTHLTNGHRFYTLGLGFWSKIFNPDLGSWVLKFLVLSPRSTSWVLLSESKV